MSQSDLIDKAKSLIASVKSKQCSIEENAERAVSLAALMLEEANRIQTEKEKHQQTQLAGMMRDPIGKLFVTTITDQCFRSHSNKRVADQLAYLIRKMGVPSYLSLFQKAALYALAIIGKFFSFISVPLTVKMIRKETSNVIVPGEAVALVEHMKRRKEEGVRVNLNHLGEAVLGEEEAERRLKIYLDDLAKPGIDCISVKISTIYSQINLLAWKETLDHLADRLRQLYRAAMKNPFADVNGETASKLVNLDMEEYRDLHVTVALFRLVLDEPEFLKYQAGIVLQSYLPDSYLLQQELTLWAMQRLAQGGAPIKIRIVKGANLAMEQFDAALRMFPQAPYLSKDEVDANYKRMLAYGCKNDHAKAVHIGIASHNLFDIAYALLLRSENNVEQYTYFEMLEGMADHVRRVVQQLSGDMLLYCPAATKEEFQNAVAYLVRRLDENTAPENFLRQAFDLEPGREKWKLQADRFFKACQEVDRVSYLPRRMQNRFIEKYDHLDLVSFKNEPDTDWTLQQNRKWAEHIVQEWKEKQFPLIPLVIGGEMQMATSLELMGKGESPATPGKILYHYSLANEQQIDQAVASAKGHESHWSQTPLENRLELLSKIARMLRIHRKDLIGAMVADTGKTIVEADVEVSEAIDFAEYYRHSCEKWHCMPDIDWCAKGTIVVATPWNFPCSISAGGILAALVTGNCVIFKPAREAVLTGWTLVQLFWSAGISRAILQFVVCEDDPVGSLLIADQRISSVVLTGASETARHFLRLHPGIDLMAETGGKNTMVITAMADRDLAIKDLVQSAFGHAGQKCSACSLAILEAEVYDDSHFLNQLRDAAASLAVGSSWDLKTKINPLISPPNGALLQAISQLEPGEEWLLEPRQVGDNPHLWSPGIKLGVKPDSFTFQNELFGPVLGLVRACTFAHAMKLMNQTPYGLTAGLHSLDEREHKLWLNKIEAGNCYINRTMTGAIVERQPFGGCKESGFGKGAKAGGANYLTQFMQPKQIDLPGDLAPPNEEVQKLTERIKQAKLYQKESALWKKSVGSYAFRWNAFFSHFHDPSPVQGQDNLQGYKLHPLVILRGLKGDSSFNLLRFVAAALTCDAKIEISLEEEETAKELIDLGVSQFFPLKIESDLQFIQRVRKGDVKRVRLLQKPSSDLKKAFAEMACRLSISPVMANGRLELLHLLREVNISHDYQRYGYLGLREKSIIEEIFIDDHI